MRVIKKTGECATVSAREDPLGLQKACWKRAVSEEQLSNVLLKVQQEVSARYDNEIPSDELGEIVMKFLSDVDQVAYVRFASVYREFKDVRRLR
ncbi:MAG: ATP cone domain-containing protein [Pirellulaceae bacterium]